MTEPENFEEDLFADLYDDDTPAKAAAAPEPAAAPAPAAAPVQTHDTHAEPPPSADPDHGADDQMRYEDEDDDDEVDFNLGGGGGSGGGGGGATTSHAPPSNGMGAVKHEEPTYSTSTAKNPSAKEDGKMFIGGLNWETTDQSLRDYFSQFGEVVECTVMRDSSTGRSRGFGFLTFRDPKTVNIVMVKEHFLDGKIIDPKRAIPRDEQEKTSKIFVGGVSQETTDQEFKDYFQQFGRVVDATLMMDKDTGRPRGFGFVTFESEAGVEACLSTSLEIHGKPIEVKKAQPRGNLREEEEAARRGGGKFRKGDDAASQGGMGGGQMGAAGGMTPQVMAQYFQRMQQYFAMMQQQMAMSRGMGPMNPAMMQQMMQMQQMQQMQNQMMGRGGGGNGQNMMGQMTPQMMQQMQQMQQQMQQQMGQQMGQQGGPPAGPSGSFSPQQQMFDPSQGGQAQQQGPRRGGSTGSGGGRDQYNNNNQQAAYNMGGGGAPTSWEGMYDDVPQPNMNPGGGRGGGFNRGNRGAHQGSPDPAHAPPANAPTGPKNAGKPGANYRGGGRSSNRGFHPYSR
ncbi:hypothetical protein K4K48_008930 [Colletotrichum sp. SAR 10_66]|nr:hypothetical protein K4K48_008930 [Colletotrichum sp. SAR 10_66]